MFTMEFIASLSLVNESMELANRGGFFYCVRKLHVICVKIVPMFNIVKPRMSM